MHAQETKCRIQNDETIQELWYLSPMVKSKLGFLEFGNVVFSYRYFWYRGQQILSCISFPEFVIHSLKKNVSSSCAKIAKKGGKNL